MIASPSRSGSVTRLEPSFREATAIVEARPAIYSIGQSTGLSCVAGLDGNLKQLDPEWSASLGWTVEELLARPFVGFVHPEDRATTLAELVKLAGGARTIAFEHRYAHRDGS
jgi:PAS domain-containing protein